MLENTEQNNQNAPTEEEIEDMKKEYEQEIPGKFYIFKCKPTYNFQSIEFEFACTEDGLDEMFELYGALLNGLMAIAPAQPSAIPAKELASARQKEIMDKFGIKYKASTTREEAQALIQKSIEAVSKK